MTGRTIVGAILASGLAVLALAAAPLPLPEGSTLNFRREVAREVALPPPFGPEGRRKELPCFDAASMARYKSGPETRFSAAVRKAQLALWATSTAKAPADLAGDVDALRARWRIAPSALRRAYAVPGGGRAGEVRFQARLLEDNKGIGRMIWQLTELLDELKGLEAMRPSHPPRWQANYDLARACVQSQLVVLEHQQAGLGTMRKELPLLNQAMHVGWRLVPGPITIPRNKEVKELLNTSRALFERVIKEHAGTVWAEQAQRAKEAQLGLEWEAVPGGRVM